MTRTKKPAQAAADLPITETTAVPAKTRASRSKLAIAQRAVAKATETNDWSAVTDAQVKLVEAAKNRTIARAMVNDDAVVAHAASEVAKAITGPYADMTDDQAEREIAEINAHLDDLEAGVREAFLQSETDMAIAALEESNAPDPEIVRSLADIDGIEEAAAARLARQDNAAGLERLVDDIEWIPGKRVLEVSAFKRPHLVFSYNDDGSLQVTPCCLDAGPKSDIALPPATYGIPFTFSPTGQLAFDITKADAETMQERMAMHRVDDLNDALSPVVQQEVHLGENAADGSLFYFVGTEEALTWLDAELGTDEILSGSQKIRDVVDILIATGAWTPPAGDEKEINKYWDGIKLSMRDALGISEAREYARAAAVTRAKEIEADLAEQRATVMRQDEQIADLQRLLATRNTEIDRLVGEQENLQSNITGSRVFLDEMNEVLASMNTERRELMGKLDVLQSDLKTSTGHNRRLGVALQNVMKRGFLARLFNVPPVLPLSEPVKVNPDAFKPRNSRSTTAGLTEFEQRKRHMDDRRAS